MNNKFKFVSLISIFLIAMLNLTSCLDAIGLLLIGTGALKPSDSSYAPDTDCGDNKLIWKYYTVYMVDGDNSTCIRNNDENDRIVISELEKPTPKEGHYFYGWSLDRNCLEPGFFDKNTPDEVENKTQLLLSEQSGYLFNFLDKGEKNILKEEEGYAEISYTFYFYPVWIPYEKMFRSVGYNKDFINVDFAEKLGYDSDVKYWGVEHKYKYLEFDKLSIPSEIDGNIINYLPRLNYSFPSCRILHLPSTIEYIDYDFYRRLGEKNSNIACIEIDENNEYYKVVDNVVYSKDMKTIFCFPANKDISTWTIPSSVENIEANAFDGVAVENFDFTNIKTLSRCSFSGTNLVEIEIPDTVNFVNARLNDFRPDYAFSGCKSLKKVVIDSKIIPIATFTGCDELEDITIGKNVKSIELFGLGGCYKFTEIKYEGTIEDWNNIKKHNKWFDSKSADCERTITIKCTDGDLVVSTHPAPKEDEPVENPEDNALIEGGENEEEV